MRVIDAISKVDHMAKNNDMALNEKIGYLSELDLKLKKSILDQYEKIEIDPDFSGYTTEDEEKELLVAEPYSDLYVYWLLAKIALSNGDGGQYNYWNAMFQSSYDSFFRFINVNYRRKSTGYFKF